MDRPPLPPFTLGNRDSEGAPGGGCLEFALDPAAGGACLYHGQSLAQPRRVPAGAGRQSKRFCTASGAGSSTTG